MSPELRQAIALLASWGLSTMPEDRPRGTRSASEITLVRQARQHGATWKEIGEATGYSKGSAYNRWHRFSA